MDSQEAHERKRRMAVIAVSALVLVAMVAAIGVGLSEGLKKSGDSGVVTSNRAIKDICQTTDYRRTCEESLATSESSEASDPIQLIQTAFHVAVHELQTAVANSTTIKNAYNDPRTAGAIQTCQEVMNYAIGDLDKSIKQMGQIQIDKLNDYVENLKVWLSGAINYQETCLDAFENTTGDASITMKNLLNTSRQLTSNGLAMASGFSTFLTGFNLSALQLAQQGPLSEPAWAGQGRQLLLLAAAEEVKADVVVAKDGSGKYKTVNEALNEVPVDGVMNKTFVIRIKEGVYEEKVQVGASMKNVVFVGDGPAKTRITGRQNLAEGIPSYKTATVAVMGEGFMAKDIAFENSAGPGKGSAVALLVQSDRSIFHNCYISGHTNSLYTINYRQFFSNCTISGAVDFITGDAIAVFQSSLLLIRPPNSDAETDKCFITAQTRSDKREPSGFVFQNCTIGAEGDYARDKTTSYLGRPKKEYSSVVYMESEIDDVIDAEGWAQWSGKFGIETCFYAEYKNRGNGARLDGRVKWPGIQNLDPTKAGEFTAARFIGGDTWIKPAGVPYIGGMMNI